MKDYSTGTGSDIDYKDYSNSAIGTSIYQSSADPTNIASVMRNAIIFVWEEPLSEAQLVEQSPGEKLQALENISDKELAALYAEAAEEDAELARIGLAHYAKLLKQEEESE